MIVLDSNSLILLWDEGYFFEVDNRSNHIKKRLFDLIIFDDIARACKILSYLGEYPLIT